VIEMLSKLPWKIVEVDLTELAAGAKDVAVDIEDAEGHTVAYEVLREDAKLIVAKVNK